MTAGPPVIPGYEFVELLGKGGCATVYRYRERSEQYQRDVAVKVLRDLGLGDVTSKLFVTEAQSMALLGDHPNIVQVFKVDVTPAGERYIVMQYYPNGDLASAVHARPFGVDRALDVGVRIAGAVQTAHQAEILHRDIKPANILTDKYGNPGLTDFGIAGRIATIGEDASGLSVAWAAPEVVRGADASVVTDVYSLVATVWQLLVGRSPFSDARGVDNSMEAITNRVLTMPPPPTGRPDVPQSLERLLAAGLAKDPRARPQTAMAFADGLQAVARELRLRETPLDVVQDGDLTTVRPRQSPPSTGGTRVRVPSQARPVLPREVYHAAREVYQPPRPSAPPAAVTAVRQVQPQPEAAVVALRPRRLLLVLAGAAAAIAAVVTGLVIITSGPPEPDAPTQPSATRDVGPQDAGVPGADVPPGVPAITAGRIDDATVRFSWTYSARLDSDTFAWRTQSGGGANGTADTPTVDIPAAAGSTICLQVKVVRADGSNATTDWSPAGCSG
jgi:serine/threonine protein kinase